MSVCPSVCYNPRAQCRELAQHQLKMMMMVKLKLTDNALCSVRSVTSLHLHKILILRPGRMRDIICASLKLKFRSLKPGSQTELKVEDQDAVFLYKHIKHFTQCHCKLGKSKMF